MVDAPSAKGQKPKMSVPMFETMADVLAINFDDEEPSEGAGTLTRTEIAERAKELLRDPEARAALFRGE